LNTKTKIVNLHGGPGVGKSTVASAIFTQLKQKRISCELVTEVPKDIVWDENYKALSNQLYIFSEQFRRQWRLIDKVDWVITDSPLLMYAIYFDMYINEQGTSAKFTEEYKAISRKFFDDTFHQFNNWNYYIASNLDYDPVGRGKNPERSNWLHNEVRKKLLEHDPQAIICCGETGDIANEIVGLIESRVRHDAGH
jgi:deoxyadenosine/deoxycytidine kinase